MTRGKAEDAGGLTPAKDDNAAPYHFDRRSLPIFKCVDYKLVVKDELYVCPNCRQKIHQAFRPDAEARNLPLWCKNCKAIFLVNIEHGQCFVLSRCR